jgi:hypothetical protein
MAKRPILFAVALILIILAPVLCGCATRPPEVRVRVVENKIPVPVPVKIPDGLKTPFALGELPIFIPPSAPGARVALDEEGAARMRILLRDLVERVNVWETWAASQAGSTD